MIQFYIRTLEFANGKVNKINVTGRATIDLYIRKHDVKSLHSNNYSKSETSSYIVSGGPTAEELENRKILKSEIRCKLFNIKTDLRYYPIMGSKVADDYGIRYEGTVKDLYIPNVNYILRDTLSVQVKNDVRHCTRNGIIGHGQKYYDKNAVSGMRMNGTLLHMCIPNMLQGHFKSFDIPRSIAPAYFSIKSVMSVVRHIEKLEYHVVHPMLRYHGIVDCIAHHGNEKYVIEWKISGKPKRNLESTKDATLQLAAYIGAINASQSDLPPIKKGLLVIAYPNGDAASVYVLQEDALQNAWEKWLIRLKFYYTNLKFIRYRHCK